MGQWSKGSDLLIDIWKVSGSLASIAEQMQVQQCNSAEIKSQNLQYNSYRTYCKAPSSETLRRASTLTAASRTSPIDIPSHG